MPDTIRRLRRRVWQVRARPIAEDETTLAQILSEHGYATAGIIAGPWMKKRFRLNKGFEHYDDDGVTALNGRPAEDVTRAAIEYVDEHRDDGFFLFLNQSLFEPRDNPCECFWMILGKRRE